MRAGLYKQLSELQALLSEFREDPEANTALKPAIADAVLRAGMQKDCPFRVPDGGAAAAEVELTPENVDEVDGAEFEEYCTRLYGCVVRKGLLSNVCSACAVSVHSCVD